jgi:hypothetical protein
MAEASRMNLRVEIPQAMKDRAKMMTRLHVPVQRRHNVAVGLNDVIAWIKGQENYSKGQKDDLIRRASKTPHTLLPGFLRGLQK